MVFQGSAFFRGATSLSMIGKIQTLVPPKKVSAHFFLPLKIFILDLVHNLINRLLVQWANYLRSLPLSLGVKVSSKSRGVNYHSHFPFYHGHLACSWSSFSLLYSSILSINLCISVTGLNVTKALRSKSMWSPTLKVLIATPLLIPLISLYSS